MICQYIHSVMPVDFKEWTVYSPTDIPLQKHTSCGVHVCSWAYIITSGNTYLFEDENMNTARRSIANILMQFKITMNRKRRIKMNKKNVQELPDQEIVSLEVKNNVPLEFPSTLEFFRNLPFMFLDKHGHYTRSSK